MRSHRLRAPLRAAAAAVAAGCCTLSPLADAMAAGSGRPQGIWTGITYGNNYSKFSFRVAGNHVTGFVDRVVGCNSYPGGYITQTITFPGSATIGAGGSFTEVRHPVRGATDILRGSFHGASASGTLVQSGVCDTGVQHWVARVGRIAPKPPRTHLAACSPAACAATDKLVFHVTSVDRTLTTIQNPNAGPYSDTVDSGLTATGGGVLVTVTVTNPTSSAISLATPNEFTLEDGQGDYDLARNEDGYDVLAQDGHVATDANTCLSQLVTVPPKATSGPVTLCFAVPAAARRSMHVLFDYPTTMAKIPLQ